MSFPNPDPLDDVDPRLTRALEESADEWGALGVLTVAASMWPDAYIALIRQIANAPTPQPVDTPADEPAPADDLHHVKLTYAEWCERFVRIMPEPDNHHNAAECPYCRPRSRSALRG
jgi:hypothetical protein